MHFKDRIEAGQKLASKLQEQKIKDAIIFALPRGGVILGAEIAKVLKVPLDLVIARKIGHPANPEYAIGAVSESGELFCNEEERRTADPIWFKKEVEKQQKEARRRRKVYLKDKKSISPEGKIAILVDDGIATGLTIKVAIKEIKSQHPKKIIVAVPVLPKDTARELKKEIDELVALDIPDYFLGSIGAYYDYFPQVEDREVIDIIRKV
ncbi:MAG: phosphoribosyltransferase family protein [Candidatus Berkelbacteria bacterium]|nr:phosphoribosyltransferase family protein [Candidatus Berkelbacteria bacterium]